MNKPNTNSRSNARQATKKKNNKKSTKKTNQKSKRNKKQTANKGKSSIGKKIGWFFLILSLILSLCVLIAGLFIYFKYGATLIRFQEEAQEAVIMSDRNTFRQAETSLVYDVKGKPISVLKGEKDVYYLDYKDIPDIAIKAMISIEDKKYMSHEGVDLFAIIRAMRALIKNDGDITQGASTITQQLARNIFLSNEVTYERKLKEIFIAIELEKKYSKEDIMEFYLNNIYFANGYYGIEAASKGYFSKSAKDLTLSEVAFLCAIPNNPTIYNPLHHMDNTKSRRNRILDQMYQDGRIGLEDYNMASNQEITLSLSKVKKNNYVDTYVYYCAIRALMEEQGFEFQYRFDNKEQQEKYEEKYYDLYYKIQKSLYFEGYRIYTSIDMKKQKLLQQAVDNTLKEYGEVNKEGIYTLQGAAVSIDNTTGKVAAIVGGRSQEYNGYTLNRGYQSYRQPGSAIKPIIVYAPSFERGYYPDSIVVDEPIKDGPSNSGRTYSGKMELRKAIEVSKNTIAWKMFEELTPEVGLSYLLNMNFSKIDKKDYIPAASLGGFTIGTSPVELTSAYAALENDGIYREPTCIIKILDAEGNEIVGEVNKQKRIYDTNAARMMTNVLEGVMKRGTGKSLALEKITSAGKTGTTNDNKDGWFVGYTPYYTTGVWVGYDIPKSLSNLYGSKHPGTIWKTYMDQIHKNLENEEFLSYTDNRPPKVKEEEAEEDSAIDQEKAEDAKPGKDKDKAGGSDQKTDNSKNKDPNSIPDSGEEWNESNGDDFYEDMESGMDFDDQSGLEGDFYEEDTDQEVPEDIDTDTGEDLNGDGDMNSGWEEDINGGIGDVDKAG
ncbi:transglycosylase domain-containing protein [Anaerocolumna sp.]|uniref:transglycosylase domain-containing protein n=1 Tax=Anaerocolumna sp. TaxID=2041569 RepID=UPI0028AD1740|nr:PBP1A family penicillin-binding protein [Anaerocolumna sp.]